MDTLSVPDSYNNVRKTQRPTNICQHDFSILAYISFVYYGGPWPETNS